MCLEMRTADDQKLMNSFRKKGHRLMKGYKIVQKRDIDGKLQSLCQDYFIWKHGWNQAQHSCGKPRFLPIRRLKPTKALSQSRVVDEGIHIYINPRRASQVMLGDWTIRTVWFYADEVRAAEVDDFRGDVVVVNRALMRRTW